MSGSMVAGLSWHSRCLFVRGVGVAKGTFIVHQTFDEFAARMKSYSIPSTADFLMPPTSAVMNATGLSLKVVRGAVSKINNSVISVYAPGNSSSVEVFGFLSDI